MTGGVAGEYLGFPFADRPCEVNRGNDPGKVGRRESPFDRERGPVAFRDLAAEEDGNHGRYAHGNRLLSAVAGIVGRVEWVRRTRERGGLRVRIGVSG